jgi:acyl-coenzyme A thioesterase PaaI-like protein
VIEAGDARPGPLPEPDLCGPERWIALDTASKEHSKTFVSGEPDGNRLRVRYFINPTADAFMARAWFGEGAEGPHGHAHGGAVAAVLDESMGTASWCLGHPALAAKIEVEFRAMVPLGTTATVEAWVESVDGRKVSLRARMRGDDGTVYGEARGLFIEQEPEQFGRNAESARWARERRRVREGG